MFLKIERKVIPRRVVTSAPDLKKLMRYIREYAAIIASGVKYLLSVNVLDLPGVLGQSAHTDRKKVNQCPQI